VRRKDKMADEYQEGFIAGEDRGVEIGYDEGYIAGLTAYAWWKDGVQYVGTSGKTLKEAIEGRKSNWNYRKEK
jgi:hypothetical protein